MAQANRRRNCSSALVTRRGPTMCCCVGRVAGWPRHTWSAAWWRTYLHGGWGRFAGPSNNSKRVPTGAMDGLPILRLLRLLRVRVAWAVSCRGCKMGVTSSADNEQSMNDDGYMTSFGSRLFGRQRYGMQLFGKVWRMQRWAFRQRPPTLQGLRWLRRLLSFERRSSLTVWVGRNNSGKIGWRAPSHGCLEYVVVIKRDLGWITGWGVLDNSDGEVHP